MGELVARVHRAAHNCVLHPVGGIVWLVAPDSRLSRWLEDLHDADSMLLEDRIHHDAAPAEDDIEQQHRFLGTVGDPCMVVGCGRPYIEEVHLP